VSQGHKDVEKDKKFYLKSKKNYHIKKKQKIGIICEPLITKEL